MERPKYGQIWRLKSDKARTLKINYVNDNDIVGFTDATYRKRRYGTMRLDVFLRRYEMTEKIPVQVAADAYDEARSQGETPLAAMRISLLALADRLETEPDRDACAVYLRVTANEDEE